MPERNKQFGSLGRSIFGHSLAINSLTKHHLEGQLSWTFNHLQGLKNRPRGVSKMTLFRGKYLTDIQTDYLGENSVIKLDTVLKRELHKMIFLGNVSKFGILFLGTDRFSPDCIAPNHLRIIIFEVNVYSKLKKTIRAHYWNDLFEERSIMGEKKFLGRNYILW